MNQFKYTAVIPARGGSKGIKNKNIKKLGDKTLIEWTIEAAKKVLKIDNIIISTDSLKIKKIAEKNDINVRCLRPKKYSCDSTTANELVKYLIKSSPYKNDILEFIIYLQPTSPLRNSKDINNALEIFEREFSKNESLISVNKIDVKYNWTLKSTNKSNFIKFSNKNINLRKNRQALQQLYLPNGAIYIFKKYNFKSMYTDKIIKYEMDAENSIDIDNHFDLERAKKNIKNNDYI